MLTEKFVSQIFALSLQFEDPKLGAENQNQQSFFWIYDDKCTVMQIWPLETESPK